MIGRLLQRRPGADDPADPDPPFWRTVGQGAFAGLAAYAGPHAMVCALSLYAIALAPLGLIFGPAAGGVVGLAAVALSRALEPRAAAPGRRLLFRGLLSGLGALTVVHAAVLERDVVNKFLDEDRLAGSRAAEEPDFAALHEGCDEVDDLDPRLERFDLR